jgi:5-methyltetrahydropteroyltriglutamate--homocysteine methyltransferase
LDAELKSWLAFAVQKCAEVAVLAQAVNQPDAPQVLAALAQSRAVQAGRAASPRIHKPAVQARVAAITATTASANRRSPNASRRSAPASTCRCSRPPPSVRSRKPPRSAWRASP